MARQRLKQRIEECGFTPERLAREIKVSRKTIDRLVSGETKLHVGKRPLLAEKLKWSVQRLTAELNGDAAPRLEDGFWSNFLTLERNAVSERCYESLLVPGILQTKDYAEALLEDEEHVARRLDRQRLVTRSVDPLLVIAILDESVLLRPIGGRATLAGQLDHLVGLAALPNVIVRIVSFAATEQPAYWGALTVVLFPWNGGLVYLEHKEGHRSLDSPEAIRNHLAVFDQLEDLAMSPDASVDQLRQRAKEAA